MFGLKRPLTLHRPATIRSLAARSAHARRSLDRAGNSISQCPTCGASAGIEPASHLDETAAKVATRACPEMAVIA
jgi:hypothetical protein